MSILSRFFGGKGGETAPQGEDYNGFMIYPEPIREGKDLRLSARIVKEIDGEVKEHTLIRADTFQSEDEAIAASRAKAIQMIEEQGDRLFR